MRVTLPRVLVANETSRCGNVHENGADMRSDSLREGPGESIWSKVHIPAEISEDNGEARRVVSRRESPIVAECRVGKFSSLAILLDSTQGSCV